MIELLSIEKEILSNINIDKSWSFAEKTIKDTTYITHGYYTYPAKFIPQLASRLINELSNENDIVIDPFMGSGTTIVEAIVNKRIGIGTDINDIAYLLAKVKSTPIKPLVLLEELNKIEFDLQNRLNGQYDVYLKKSKNLITSNARIDYWFKPEEKRKLAFIFNEISKLKDQDIRDFFYCGFSNILKNIFGMNFINA